MENIKPDWDQLYQIAEEQGGYFMTAQADEANISPPLLNKHLNRKIERVRRGIYRLIHYPQHEQGDLIVFWLWTEKSGIFSHDTALFMHDLSDALPRFTTMTVPLAWKKRRMTNPEGLRLYYDDIAIHSWMDTVPVTDYLRTLEDCSNELALLPFFEQGLEEAKSRGLINAFDATRLWQKRNRMSYRLS